MSDKMTIVFLCIFFFLGFVLGVFAGIKDTSEVIKECQKTLPRNVECVIVAVPETDVEEES